MCIRDSCMSRACPAAHSSSTVLPMPASPCRTSTLLSPSRTAASTPASAVVSVVRSSSSLIAQSSRCDGASHLGRPSPQGGIRPSSRTCHRGTSRSGPEGPAAKRGGRSGARFGLPDERELQQRLTIPIVATPLFRVTGRSDRTKATFPAGGPACSRKPVSLG